MFSGHSVVALRLRAAVVIAVAAGMPLLCAALTRHLDTPSVQRWPDSSAGVVTAPGRAGWSMIPPVVEAATTWFLITCAAVVLVVILPRLRRPSRPAR